MIPISSAVNEVEGKMATVTGVVSGIGRAIVELLHARGAKVVAEDSNPEVERLASRRTFLTAAVVTAAGTTIMNGTTQVAAAETSEDRFERGLQILRRIGGQNYDGPKDRLAESSRDLARDRSNIRMVTSSRDPVWSCRSGSCARSPCCSRMAALSPS